MSVVRSPVRSVVRSPVRGVFGGSASLLDEATSYLNGIAPYHWFDFINDRCLYASSDVGGVSGATGYSFTRASEGYYQNADGTLTLFASGALRRGDRGVLIEGARTNLLLRSQEFDNASWTKSDATVTANAIAAPDGTLTADLMTASGAGSVAHAVYGTGASATSGTAYTASVFVRASTGRYFSMRGDAAASGAPWITIDLQTGAVLANAAVTSSGVTALANSWYRIWLVWTANATGGVNVVFAANNAATAPSTVTNLGTAFSQSGESFYIWGAQLEAASFFSSYIPTTTASATRAADVLTCTAGVSYPISLWAEFERAVDTNDIETFLCLDSGAGNDEVIAYVSGDRWTLLSETGAAAQAVVQVASNLSILTTHKGAVRVAANDFNACSNATLGTADVSGTAPGTATRVVFGSRNSSANPAFGYIRRAAIFNSALSDANLQSVTG